MSLCRTAFVLIRAATLPKVLPQISGSKSIHRWVAPTLNELKRRRDKIGPEAPQPRSTFLEWNYEAELFAFGKRLGENFDRDLLLQALTHRSYVNVKEGNDKKDGKLPEIIKDNLEFIKEGDEIVRRYVSRELTKKYSDVVADSVTEYLLSRDMLAHVAKHMGLVDIVQTSEFPVEDETLANTFKSVVTALKLSDSLERAELFVKDFLLSQLNGKDVYEIWDPEKPFEYLNLLLKEKGMNDIEPRLCNQSASNTILANYQVGLYNNKKLLGIGWGESIEIAKNTAALDAIKRIHASTNKTL